MKKIILGLFMISAISVAASAQTVKPKSGTTVTKTKVATKSDAVNTSASTAQAGNKTVMTKPIHHKKHHAKAKAKTKK